ncbi:MAG: hypothetical protein P4M13_06505 [Alphaproteobacteria bacterium]|nr:hypothetical protein [Alphaproteobacteria bacterium]
MSKKGFQRARKEALALKRMSEKGTSPKSQSVAIVHGDRDTSNAWRSLARWATLGVVSIVALVGVKATAFAAGEICGDADGDIYFSAPWLKGHPTATDMAILETVAKFVTKSDPTIKDVPEIVACPGTGAWRRVHPQNNEEKHRQLVKEALQYGKGMKLSSGGPGGTH